MGKVIQNAYDETTDVFNLLDEAEVNFQSYRRNIRKTMNLNYSYFKAQSEIDCHAKEDGINGVSSGFKVR